VGQFHFAPLAKAFADFAAKPERQSKAATIAKP
jgi:hypothetical protein